VFFFFFFFFSVADESVTHQNNDFDNNYCKVFLAKRG